MQGILYEEQSIWLFLLVTVCMGGWAAWMTGRAVAITWRPFWQYVAGGCSCSPASCASSTSPCSRARCARCTTISLTRLWFSSSASSAIRYTRANQMTTQYRWLYERTGPLTWREKPPLAHDPA